MQPIPERFEYLDSEMPAVTPSQVADWLGSPEIKFVGPVLGRTSLLAVAGGAVGYGSLRGTFRKRLEGPTVPATSIRGISMILERGEGALGQSLDRRFMVIHGVSDLKVPLFLTTIGLMVGEFAWMFGFLMPDDTYANPHAIDANNPSVRLVRKG